MKAVFISYARDVGTTTLATNLVQSVSPDCRLVALGENWRSERDAVEISLAVHHSGNEVAVDVHAYSARRVIDEFTLQRAALHGVDAWFVPFSGCLKQIEESGSVVTEMVHRGISPSQIFCIPTEAVSSTTIAQDAMGRYFEEFAQVGIGVVAECHEANPIYQHLRGKLSVIDFLAQDFDSLTPYDQAYWELAINARANLKRIYDAVKSSKGHARTGDRLLR